ncbi:hypothetical protein BZA70DRAFT_268412 [Myxozyma melibiosi]|uniref:Uncharacterized protein n=1 Tax=Myxozyma melibiosi TaxID=54550 RepID=A0ABR1F2B7_9ASCO
MNAVTFPDLETISPYPSSANNIYDHHHHPSDSQDTHPLTLRVFSNLLGLSIASVVFIFASVVILVVGLVVIALLVAALLCAAASRRIEFGGGSSIEANHRMHVAGKQSSMQKLMTESAGSIMIISESDVIPDYAIGNPSLRHGFSLRRSKTGSINKPNSISDSKPYYYSELLVREQNRIYLERMRHQTATAAAAATAVSCLALWLLNKRLMRYFLDIRGSKISVVFNKFVVSRKKMNTMSLGSGRGEK